MNKARFPEMYVVDENTVCIFPSGNYHTVKSAEETVKAYRTARRAYLREEMPIPFTGMIGIGFILAHTLSYPALGMIHVLWYDMMWYSTGALLLIIGLITSVMTYKQRADQKINYLEGLYNVDRIKKGLPEFWGEYFEGVKTRELPPTRLWWRHSDPFEPSVERQTVSA